MKDFRAFLFLTILSLFLLGLGGTTKKKMDTLDEVTERCGAIKRTICTTEYLPMSCKASFPTEQKRKPVYAKGGNRCQATVNLRYALCAEHKLDPKKTKVLESKRQLVISCTPS